MGVNLCAYVEGTPLSFTDPMGFAKHAQNGKTCQDHRDKISSYKDLINKKIRELRQDKFTLPYYPRYPFAPAFSSVKGHEDFI